MTPAPHLSRFPILALAILLLAPLGSPQGRPTADLLDEVLDDPNSATAELFEAIAEPADVEAMAALKRCLRAVTRPTVTEHIVWALRHFDEDKVRRLEALMELENLVWGRSDAHVEVDPRKRTERMRFEAMEGSHRVPRTATRTLRTFGEHAVSILDELLRDHRDAVVRQLAIGGLLAKLEKEGTKEAFELLLAHYRPDVSGSFEEGVRVLRTFPEAIAAKPLARVVEDRRVEEDVRAMALQALWIHPGKKVNELLERQLGSDSPRLQRIAVEGLDTRGVTGHERELARIVRSKKKNRRAVRHAALVALARALRAAGETDELRKLAFEAGEDDRFELRVGATTVLAWLHEVEARGRLVEMLRDVHPEVRHAAIGAVLELRLPEAIRALIDRLESDSRRLRTRAHEALVLLTGLDHGMGTRWRRWWEAEGEGFDLPTLAEAKAARDARATSSAEGPTHAEFCGVPIRSDRVVFVLDRSGSMDESYRGGATRFQWVRDELAQSLGDLPDGTLLNLVVFAESARAWSRQLAPLEGDARKRLLRSLGRRPYSGAGTNLHAGLMMALRDPNVEMVVLLTDGRPTVGPVTSTRAVLDSLRVELEMRTVVVHTVSVIGYSKLLERIAAETGGEYRQL